MRCRRHDRTPVQLTACYNTAHTPTMRSSRPPIRPAVRATRRLRPLHDWAATCTDRGRGRDRPLPHTRARWHAGAGRRETYVRAPCEVGRRVAAVWARGGGGGSGSRMPRPSGERARHRGRTQPHVYLAPSTHPTSALRMGLTQRPLCLVAVSEGREELLGSRDAQVRRRARAPFPTLGRARAAGYAYASASAAARCISDRMHAQGMHVHVHAPSPPLMCHQGGAKGGGGTGAAPGGKGGGLNASSQPGSSITGVSPILFVSSAHTRKRMCMQISP